MEDLMTQYPMIFNSGIIGIISTTLIGVINSFFSVDIKAKRWYPGMTNLVTFATSVIVALVVLDLDSEPYGIGKIGILSASGYAVAIGAFETFKSAKKMVLNSDNKDFLQGS